MSMWYFQDPVTKGRRGPVNVTEIMMLHSSGEIHDQSLVWTKGMKDWARFAKVPELESQIVKPSTEKIMASFSNNDEEKHYYYVDTKKNTCVRMSMYI